MLTNITTLEPTPNYDSHERIMPFTGAIEITIPLANSGPIDLLNLYDIEVWLVVNGEYKLRFRKLPPVGLDIHKQLFVKQNASNKLLCYVSSIQTTEWRGLVQAHIKLIGVDTTSTVFSNTHYIPVNLFIARKGTKLYLTPQEAAELLVS